MCRIVYAFLMAFIFLGGCAAQETVKKEPPQVQEITPGQKSFITPPAFLQVEHGSPLSLSGLKLK